MSKNSSTKIKRLFQESLDLPVEKRTPFLRVECADDPDLLAEVLSLLRAYEVESSFLEDSPLDGLKPHAKSDAEQPTRELTRREEKTQATRQAASGKKIGPYRLLKTLGEGGMGAVHLAERDDPSFRQRVAIKVIRAGLNTREVVERFVQERQILAALVHPNIAHLLDGGTTERGEPYFVMEYVDGLPLMTYCDRNRLDTEDRIRLFKEVCAAVQYAHQNLVVHRDLKPGNILVTHAGQVKLLDFGIAKVLNPALAAAASVTRTDVRAMTPEYASPEQVRGESVTTASDVFCLGVLLYELLTGHGPFPFSSRGLYEISRFIVESEPELPSTAIFRTRRSPDPAAETEPTLIGISGEVLTPEEVGRRRRTDPTALRRRLRGDLDAIILKAMRKEPELRYDSPARLAEDLANHLVGLPVSAAADSFSYRFSRFASRNRYSLFAGAAVTLATILFAALYTVQITRERDRAQAEANRAEAVTDFLVDLFEISDPGEARGREVTAREVLDRGADRLESELVDQPPVQARLYDVVGSIYQRLGLYARATPFYDRAIELSAQSFGDASPELATSAAKKAALLVDLGEFGPAETLVRERLEANRKNFGDDSLEVAKSLDTLATVLHRTARYDEARELFEEALEVRARKLDADDSLISTSLSNLALLLRDMGDYDEAEPLARRSLDIDRRVLGSPHPDLAVAIGNLGMLLRRQYRNTNDDTLRDAKLVEAEQLVREAYTMQRQVFGNSHFLVGTSANDLALVLQDKGDLDAAEPLFRESIEVQRRVMGDHNLVAVSLNNLAGVIANRERFDEAEAMYRESLDINQRLLGVGHPDTSYQFQGLASTYVRWGKITEAINAYRQALEIRRDALGETHPITISSILPLAELLAEQGDQDQARELLSKARQEVAADDGDAETLTALDEALAAVGS